MAANLRHAPMNDVTRILREIGSDEKLLAEQLLPLVYDELRDWRRCGWRVRPRARPCSPPRWFTRHGCAWSMKAGGRGRTGCTSIAPRHRRCAAYSSTAPGRNPPSSARAAGSGSISRIWISPRLRRMTALLLIDESLQRLEQEDPESAEIVMLKFFTGLSNKEAARTLGISESTVERRWAFAKVCLFQMIRGAEGDSPDGA